MADNTQDWIKEIQADAERTTLDRIADDKKEQARQEQADKADKTAQEQADKKKA